MFCGTQKVHKYDNFDSKSDLKCIQLKGLQTNAFMTNYALCTLFERYVILTGGGSSHKNDASKLAFLLDVHTGQWLDYPGLPSLTNGRRNHSSCAAHNIAYVFGGQNAKEPFLSSGE